MGDLGLEEGLCSSLTSTLSTCAAQADARVPAAHEVQGHRSQQQDLLRQRDPPHVRGLGLGRGLHQELGRRGHSGREDPGPGVAPLGPSRPPQHRQDQSGRRTVRRKGRSLDGGLAEQPPPLPHLWPQNSSVDQGPCSSNIRLNFEKLLSPQKTRVYL